MLNHTSSMRYADASEIHEKNEIIKIMFRRLISFQFIFRVFSAFRGKKKY